MTNLHPIHAVNDGIFNTSSGKQINLRFPTPESICMDDIARGLANTIRFGGQIAQPYTVAQHSVLVMKLAPHELRFAALMHDAAEAYIGDVIKPLKVMLGETYACIQHNFEHAIFQRFNINPSLMKEVKQYDLRALEIENEMRYMPHPNYALEFSRLFPEGVWNHQQAFHAFQVCFKNYSKTV